MKRLIALMMCAVSLGAAAQFGCTDPGACNYEPNVTVDNGSCDYLDECGVCGGEGIDDLFITSTWVTGYWNVGAYTYIWYDVNGVDVQVFPTSSVEPEIRDQIIFAINTNIELQDMGITARSGGHTLPSSPDTQITVTDPFNFPYSFEVEVVSSEPISLSVSWQGGGTINGADGSYVFGGFCDCDGNQLDAIGVCGGSCEADDDADGICDDVDDCVGSLDACGICNGLGEMSQCGCSDENAANYDSTAIIENGTCLYSYEALEDSYNSGFNDGAASVECPTACGEGTTWDEVSQTCIVANVSDTDFDGCVGINDFLVHLSNFGSGCGPESAWSCGDPQEYQGYDYETVQIGERCWFTENLRSENYKNGDAIPAGLNDLEWDFSPPSGAVAVYGEGISSCDPTTIPDGDVCDESWSLSEYGRLYNWHAVEDARGLCPDGWHVPTDGEWTVMTDHLGGDSVAGHQMKTTYGWWGGGHGTNSSGFSGLPGGFRGFNGSFIGAGGYGIWWSSSAGSNESAWYRSMDSDFEEVSRSDGNRGAGFSVRCIQDSE